MYSYGGTTILWKSIKQTCVAILSNHAEILAIHEANRECIWLRSVVHHILKTIVLKTEDLEPITLHEDNTACIAQLKEGYIKGDMTKHISPKFFYTHELQKEGAISVKQVQSNNNLADLFTKSLSSYTFQKLLIGIGMKRLKDL